MGKLIIGENDLLTWCKNNGEWGQRLIDEWVGQYEDGTYVEMDAIYEKDGNSRNGRKVIWKCRDCGEEWPNKIFRRTLREQGCPYCSGYKVSNKNSLATWCNNNGERGKQLISEWVGITKEGKNIRMEDVAQFSSIEVKWMLPYDDETTGNHFDFTWYAAISTRTLQGQNCPYLSGRDIWVGFNDLQTTHPELCKEWHPNNKFKTTEVTAGSDFKVNWICTNGHVWSAVIRNRTSNKSGCPECTCAGTSYGEQFLYRALKQVHSCIEHRYKYKHTDGKSYEYDIAILDKNIYLEYSGDIFHVDKKERDAKKIDICTEKGIRLIQVIETNKIKEISFNENCIVYNPNRNQDSTLKMIAKYLINLIGADDTDVDYEYIANEALEYSKGKVEDDKNLALLYSNLAIEFDKEKNKGLNIDNISINSNKDVYWKCPRCRHSWVAQIYSRVHKQSGCPKCGYNWYKAKTGQPQKLKKQKTIEIPDFF